MADYADPDWSALVAKAMGDPPHPGELCAKLREWQIRFKVVEKGPPLLPDYPDAVREFFAKLATVARTGRPCRDEKLLFAARKAWEQECYRQHYHCIKPLAKLCKEKGIPWDGRQILESPSDFAVRKCIGSSGQSDETIRQKIHPPHRKK